MNSSLALSEISYPFSHSLQQKNEKSVASRPFIRLAISNKKKHLQLSNRDVGTMEVSQSLMPAHVRESCMGEKHLEDEARRKVKFVRTLLIDNYDSYTYNIYQELSVINGGKLSLSDRLFNVPPVVVHNDALTWEYLHYHLYEEKSFDNIVISPGPGSPMCPTDIGDGFFWSYIPEHVAIRNSWFPYMWNLRWWDERKPNVSPPQYFHILLECKDIPILGVCLGHQALGYAHGARIMHAPEPVHGRLSEIEHTGCNLFLDIPSGHNSGFKVVRYHSLIIDADSLPKELIPIAWSSSKDTRSFRENRESNLITDASEEQIEGTKIIMGIMHSTRPHYGVQFHPESVATCHGRQIFQNFKKMTIDYWQKSYPIHERKVPHASRIFKELPISRLLVNNLDGGGHLNKCKQVMHTNGSTCATSLKLKWKKFDRLVSQVGGAKNIFCNLFGDQKAENTFWLDSSSVEQKRARFSFMGGKGGALWRQITFRLFKKSDKIASGGGCLSIEDAQGSVESRYLEHGFLNFFDKELRSFSYEKEDYEGLPFDFVGGYVGFMGYGLKVECGVASSNSHDSRTPDACFFFADNIVVIDHHYDDLYILCVNNASLPESTPWPLESSTMSSWLDDTEQKLLCLKTSSTEKFKEKVSLSVAPCEAGFHGEKSRDQYMKDVEKCLNYIKDGESYELCLTTQMRKSIGDIDSLGLYLSLREKNPAPFAAWFNFSKENLSICCSSPERFLQLDRNGILEAKPIKGTIARGSTSAEDQQLKLKLQNSEKDQAENLMIVDLLRNDLGRVCEPGSVHVPRLMEVESYATVHTLVSTIRGKKCSNLSPVDCVRAAFPGGSMTGAPKLRSMEILDSLENCARGVYSGSIGFFSYNQTFDLNIVIRTVIVHDGEASVGAGGAIVALSNPEDEYEEMVLKTLAPVKTVMEFEST